MAQILVLGGTGFIGRHVLNRLAALSHRAIVPTRRLSHARDLYLLPTADFVVADIHDDATLARLVRGCQAVINLVGVLHSPAARGGEPYGSAFARTHVSLPRRLAEACEAAGVEQILHVSALGASADAPSEYLRSKAAGEQAVRGSGKVATTIFRPSVVFGPEDRFLNLFAEFERLLPLMFLPCPQARFQPVYVQDVASAISASLLNPAAYGANYPLCGNTVYTLTQLVEYVGRVTGHRRPVMGLSPSMSAMQARMMELSPLKLLTLDNIRSMQVDSVCDQPLPFGLRATSLEAVAPSWLTSGPRKRFSFFRSRAGR